MNVQRKVILVLSLLLGAGMATGSLVGWLTPGFYVAETANWQAQSVGQDMVDLFLITPCLLLAAWGVYRNSRSALLIWGGVVLYCTYTFTLYCFDVHFNSLFLLYCICLGLSFYSVVYFLFTQLRTAVPFSVENKRAERTAGIYFLVIAVLFYFLWLAEIVPSLIQHTIPESLAEVGLFTNGVHVIDLAVILPGIFITGILLLSGNTLGRVLAPMFLSFFFLMDCTIGFLVIVMKQRGLDSDLTLTGIMAMLAAVSLVFLVWMLRAGRYR